MSIIRRVGDVYIAETAAVVGDVTIGPETSVWPGAVIRGDVAPIRLGARVNIQDGAVLHCAHDVPLDIADDVVIAHRAIVHCRSVGPFTLIGNGAILLDHAQIGEDCLVAAGAMVPPRMVVPPGSLVMGSPARVVRPIRERERDYIRRGVSYYLDLARRHVTGEFPTYGQSTPE
ncbi:MAG TPA: gamma carbonic anhydrase family protein [Phycisphaerae bacterium]|nr:gamma carbonic anhydrase family protein [Phycisphaerae bacterium]